ncbi:MAG: AraC family transcriptional regulator [Candidatus Merdivicinus sp.]|jgi:AraC-like DNA-binding protein/quercetin dioxygenase-like cupin family protein
MKIFQEQYFSQQPGSPISAFTVTAAHPGLVSPRHWHDWYEMVFVRSGAIEEELNAQKSLLKPCDLVLIQPFDIHSTAVLSSNAAMDVVLFTADVLHLDERPAVRPQYLNSFLGQSPIESGVLVSPFPFEAEICAAFQTMSAECAAKKPGYLHMLYGQFCLILAWLQRNGELRIRSGGPSLELTRIGRICRLIEERYASGISVQDIAAASGYSSAYLSRLFRSATGKTLKSYLDYVRIREAQKILRYENASVAEISFRVGCRDASNFSRAFRRISGCSPSEFRENLQRDLSKIESKEYENAIADEAFFRYDSLNRSC